MKKMVFITIIVSIALIMPDYSFADAGTDTDLVAKIVGRFQEQSANFISVAKKYALQLFGLCATLEVAYLGIKAALGHSEIGETLKNFCLSLLAAGFFLAVINHYEEWSAALINGLKSVAGEMGDIQNSSDTAFKQAMELVSQIWEVIQSLSWFSEAGLILGMVIGLFIVIVCFCMITAQVILIKCEAYVAMASACILVGLGGSTFFRDYAVNVCKFIVSVAFKLFTLQIVIGIGYQFMREAITPKADFPTILVIIGVALVLLALVKTLPDTVAGIIQGAHIGSGPGGFMRSLQVAGAAGLSAGAGAYAAIRNTGLAMQAARSEGATGVGGTIKGTAGNLINGMRQARIDKEEQRKTVGSEIRSKITQANQRALMPK